MTPQLPTLQITGFVLLGDYKIPGVFYGINNRNPRPQSWKSHINFSLEQVTFEVKVYVEKLFQSLLICFSSSFGFSS